MVFLSNLFVFKQIKILKLILIMEIVNAANLMIGVIFPEPEAILLIVKKIMTAVHLHLDVEPYGYLLVMECVNWAWQIPVNL